MYISTFSMIGLILGIVGGSLQDHSTSNKLTSIPPESKAAIILFVVVYICTVTILGILSMRVSHVAKGETRILVAVALCVPFIAVRLVYALISGFAGLRSFSLALGNPTIYLCMAVIMEIIVVIIIISFGLTLRIIPKAEPIDQESLREMSGRSNKYPARTTDSAHAPVRVNERRKARGPISWLYYAGRDLYKSRQNQNS
jgi:magnesium-transporting ATPase (P-type)